jgi:hypothetical protein
VIHHGEYHQPRVDPRNVGLRSAGLIESSLGDQDRKRWARLRAIQKRLATLILAIESQRLTASQINEAFREICEGYQEGRPLGERLRRR